MTTLVLSAPQARAAGEVFAVINARERLIPRGTVVVRDGKIEAVGADVKVARASPARGWPLPK